MQCNISNTKSTFRKTQLGKLKGWRNQIEITCSFAKHVSKILNEPGSFKNLGSQVLLGAALGKEPLVHYEKKSILCKMLNLVIVNFSTTASIVLKRVGTVEFILSPNAFLMMVWWDGTKWQFGDCTNMWRTNVRVVKFFLHEMTHVHKTWGR